MYVVDTIGSHLNWCLGKLLHNFVHYAFKYFHAQTNATAS